MSNTVRTMLAISLVAFIAACAKKEEPPVYVTEPVPSQPVYTGKYK